jgi:hypothetical protein
MFPYVQRKPECCNKVQCRVQESMAYIFTLGTRMTSVARQTDSCTMKDGVLSSEEGMGSLNEAMNAPIETRILGLLSN